jgi:hypothetical protein
MKRYRSLLAFLCLVVALAACGGQTMHPAATVVPASPTPTSPPTRPPLTIEEQVASIAARAIGNQYPVMLYADTSLLLDQANGVNVVLQVKSGALRTHEVYKQLAFTIQKAIWTNAIAAHLADVQIWFTLDTTDASPLILVSADLVSETAHQLDWSQLDADTAWSRYGAKNVGW